MPVAFRASELLPHGQNCTTPFIEIPPWDPLGSLGETNDLEVVGRDSDWCSDREARVPPFSHLRARRAHIHRTRLRAMQNIWPLPAMVEEAQGRVRMSLTVVDDLVRCPFRRLA